MQYKTHIVGGVAMGYIIYNNIDMFSHYVNDGPTFAVATAGLILGSLIPDIDIKGSYLSRRIKPISFFTNKIFKHRGFTHKITGVITFSLLVFFIMRMIGFSDLITELFSLSFVIGMISHILLDHIKSNPMTEGLIGTGLVVIAYKNMLGLL